LISSRSQQYRNGFEYSESMNIISEISAKCSGGRDVAISEDSVSVDKNAGKVVLDQTSAVTRERAILSHATF
jgi:hypothetical protein